MKRKTLAKRFEALVDRGGECHLWIGARRGNYGHIKLSGRGPTISSHRLAWELAKGPVPSGLCVLHRCDNPPCVNVAHLFLGTQADNAADKVAKGRSGERANRKLSAAAIDEIFRLRTTRGASWTSLGRRFGVHRETAKEAVDRRLRLAAAAGAAS